MFDARTAHDETVMATYFKATASLAGPCGSRGFAVTNERTAFEGVVRREIPGDRIARGRGPVRARVSPSVTRRRQTTGINW